MNRTSAITRPPDRHLRARRRLRRRSARAVRRPLPARRGPRRRVAVAADRVEAEQRRADDRRGVGDAGREARPHTEQAAVDRPEQARVTRAEHAAAEHHLDGLVGEAEALEGDPREVDDLCGQVIDDLRGNGVSRLPRRRRRERGRSRRAWRSRADGSTRRAGSGSRDRNAPAPRARATCVGHARPRSGQRR